MEELYLSYEPLVFSLSFFVFEMQTLRQTYRTVNQMLKNNDLALFRLGCFSVEKDGRLKHKGYTGVNNSAPGERINT